MNMEKLVKIILVTTVLVIALAWAGGALAKSGTGLVDTSTGLLDKLFGREQVVVSGNYDEEALPEDSWVPFFGQDVEFEIEIKEFDADKQKCKGFGNYFNVEKEDVGWEVNRIELPWSIKTIGENLELIHIVSNANVYGTIELNSGYYTKAIGYETWWKQDEDDIKYCTLEGGEDEKPFTAEEMVEAIKIHFAEEGALGDNEILTD
jgi:hypothetical protein